MKETWKQRVLRARQLAESSGPAGALLLSYADLLALQRASFECFQAGKGGPLSGSLQHDLPALRAQMLPLLNAMERNGPEPLAAEASDLLADGTGAALDERLLAYWYAPSDRNFFAKATLQPYFSSLSESGIVPLDRRLDHADNRCPFCRGRPQLSILLAAGNADGGGRMLLCATCLTAWPFRRVVCVHCGEEDERKTGYFHAPHYEHLRLDVCESCRRYMKSVDLTKLGLAVPIVDEVAGAPLDLWARERGYEKIELNLLGL